MKTILVTSGDVDGIGFEIASRAIAQLKIPKNFRIVLFRPKVPLKDWSPTYKRKHKPVSVSSTQELNFILEDSNSPKLIEFISSDSPVDWVETTTKMCLKDSNFSLVNAPMSKSLIAESGRKDHGHTDIFKRLGRIKDVNMAFIGRYFSMILATDHISLSSVEDHLTNFDKRLDAVSMFRKTVKSDVKCAVLGLNPHASEGGIIGKFEDVFKSNRIQRIMDENNIFGPFAADSFFARGAWKEYPLIFAMYHDQGLIPFKMQHRKSASVHLTLGIPFVRTSVDHGTAKDIANKGIADFGSMLEAIKLNIKLANRGTNV